MWVMIIGSAFVTALLMLLIFVRVRRRRMLNAINKEETALKNVVIGINERLHAVYPGSKWRWVCCPAGFAIKGGIARIEVIGISENAIFMDVCLSNSGYMALHILNVVELSASGTNSLPTRVCVFYYSIHQYSIKIFFTYFPWIFQCW